MTAVQLPIAAMLAAAALGCSGGDADEVDRAISCLRGAGGGRLAVDAQVQPPVTFEQVGGEPAPVDEDVDPTVLVTIERAGAAADRVLLMFLDSPEEARRPEQTVRRLVAGFDVRPELRWAGRSGLVVYWAVETARPETRRVVLGCLP